MSFNPFEQSPPSLSYSVTSDPESVNICSMGWGELGLCFYMVDDIDPTWGLTGVTFRVVGTNLRMQTYDRYVRAVPAMLMVAHHTTLPVVPYIIATMDALRRERILVPTDYLVNVQLSDPLTPDDLSLLTDWMTPDHKERWIGAIKAHPSYKKAEALPSKEKPYSLSVVIKRGFDTAVYITSLSAPLTDAELDEWDRKIQQLDLTGLTLIAGDASWIPQVSSTSCLLQKKMEKD